MTDMEKPTGDSGASIQERLEAYLSTDEPQQQPKAEAQPAQPEQEPVAVEGSEDAVTEEQETAEPAEDAAEGEEQHLSLDTLAQSLGIETDKLDVDDDGNLFIKTKIDGQDGRAKFQDLVASYQLRGHLDNQNREVKAQREALSQKMAEIEQQTQAKIQQLEDLASIANQELTREFQTVNWQQLRTEDPAEYAAKLADFQGRQANIQRMYAEVQAGRQQASIAEQGKLQERLIEESGKLLEKIPDWADEKVAEKERNELREYGLKEGFGKDELNGITDHRAVAILRKAMLYDKLQQSKAIVDKKVKTAPKLVKPGQAVSAKERAGEDMRSLKATIKKSGGKQGIAEYLLRTGKV